MTKDQCQKTNNILIRRIKKNSSNDRRKNQRVIYKLHSDTLVVNAS